MTPEETAQQILSGIPAALMVELISKRKLKDFIKKKRSLYLSCFHGDKSDNLITASSGSFSEFNEGFKLLMGYSDSKLEIAAQNGYSPRNSPEFQRLESQYSGVLRTMDQMQEAIDVLTEYNEVCDETIQRGRRDYQNLHRRYAQDMNALKNSLIDKSLLDTVQSEKEAYKREVERLQLSMTLDGVKSKGYEEFEKKIFDFLSAYYAACTPNLNVDSTMQSRVAAIRSAIKRNSLNGSANDIANLAERMITRSSNSCLENHMKEAKRLFSNSSKVPSSSNYLVQNLLDSYQSVINVWRD